VSAKSLFLIERMAAHASRAALAVSFLLVACAAQHKTVDSSAATAPQNNQCRELKTKWESLKASIKGDSVSGRIAQIREASSQIGDDPENCVAPLIKEAYDSELRKVALLEIGSDRHEAAAVYSCGELQDGVRCVGSIADDTAHLHEALNLKTVPAGVTARVRMTSDFPLEMVKLYQALDRELTHDRKAARQVELKSDGGVQLSAATAANILFVTAQDKYGEFHKWVWLLQ
jgi:hypothetical protein